MKYLILLLILPAMAQAQTPYSAGIFTSGYLAYNFEGATGDHARQGYGYSIGLSAVGQKTSWLNIGVSGGGSYVDQPGYKSARFYVDVAPEIRIIKGLTIGKPFYMAPSMWEKQDGEARGTALELGHGVNIAYNFGPVKIETYYLRSVNSITEASKVFARSYGLRLHYFWKRR